MIHNKTLKSVGNDAVDEIKKLKKKSADVLMEITFFSKFTVILIDIIN